MHILTYSPDKSRRKRNTTNSVADSGSIPEGFGNYEVYDGDHQEVFTDMRNILCTRLLDLEDKMKTAKIIAAEIQESYEQLRKKA